MQLHYSLKDNLVLTRITSVFVLLGLLSVIWGVIATHINTQAAIFIIVFAALSLISIRCVRFSFMVFYLVSTFCVIITWRLSALAHFQISVWIYTIVMFIKVVNYLYLAISSIRRLTHHETVRHNIYPLEWQLLFIRLFIGFDLVPHFCEKLFAGSVIRNVDVASFTKLHVSHAFAMVIIAGLIEMGGAFAIACGFFTRLGAVCLAIYLIVATILGGHFSDGFIWASQGGGWEYPVLWTSLILSFAVFGSGNFSIDVWLMDHYKLPGWITFLMGGTPNIKAAQAVATDNQTTSENKQ